MTEAKATVATPIKAQTAMVSTAAPVRTLVGGTDAMRDAGETYLPKNEAESVLSYKARLKRSVLFNATGKTVADMTGKVFTKDVVIEGDMPATLKGFAENIDNAGRHLNVFARDVFYDSMQPGIGFIYVDMPPKLVKPDGQPVTQADEQKAGVRPYMTFVPLERLIGWKSEKVNGAERLTQIRIMECVTEDDGEWGEREIQQIRVVDRGSWRTYRRSQTDQNEWVEHDKGTIYFGSTPADEIALVPVYINRTGFMAGAPPLAKLAELNIAHWQSDSDQRNILHVARVPILFWSGKEEADKLEIGAGSAVYSSNPASKLGYVEHTGSAINAGRDDLKDLEFRMQTMGLQLLVPQPGGKTATGEVHDEQENSPLAMMATALQDAIEGAFGYMAKFIGETHKAGSVKVNKDFGIQLGAATLQDLLSMANGGKLSNETFWAECQRRGVLDDSFDPEVEKERLAAEAPELDGDPKKTFGKAA